MEEEKGGLGGQREKENQEQCIPVCSTLFFKQQAPSLAHAPVSFLPVRVLLCSLLFGKSYQE
jgi:hypothetical protein